MVRPCNFMFNQETAVTNHYQDENTNSSDSQWRQRAVEEFDTALATLRENSIKVTVFQDMPYHVRPDAVFPNNWISVHHSGEVILYPMATPNRRLERRQDLIQWLKDNFEDHKVIDLMRYEDEGKYLEGTGSIVFDYQGKVAHACESVRTHPEVFRDMCEQIDFEPVLLQANDKQGRPIYHTNVFMSIMTSLAVICMEAITGNEARADLEARMTKSGRKIVTISQDQVDNLAGNCYEVIGEDGRSKIILSTRAWSSLNMDQRALLEGAGDVVTCNVDTIEKVGGGGIRCMLAGIFAQRK